MPASLEITPYGHLRVADDPDAQPEIPAEIAAAVEQAFARSSGEGLLRLAGLEQDQELPPAMVFWRGLARELFQAFCQLGEEAFDSWRSVPPPPDERLSQLASDAPPMRGLEFLTTSLLRDLWIELREAAAARAEQFPAGPSAWLRTVSPLWHLLGRVTFHLAENKRDPDRPFAFLATYTHRLSAQGKLQHLPLTQALKTYAGTQHRAALDSLLEPVRRAAELSPLARELLDSKALFAPQAWTIRQAHRFLHEAPKMEEAGVVLRLPDWWSVRRPPRPRVQVQIGSRSESRFGMDQLLEFRVSLALEGEDLSEEECRQLLESAEGLVLLRGKWVEVDRQQLQQALEHWQRLEQENPDGIGFIEGMRLLAGAPIGAEETAAEQVADWSRIAAGDELRRMLDRMRQPDHDGACQPGRDLQATLRPYQAEGVRWLCFMTDLGLGACLADDMGLGKAIQVIDLLLHLKRSRPAQGGPPSLLIVPASLIGNWRQELARFGPSLRVFFAHRSECDTAELARVSEDPKSALAGFDLVITTYGLVRRQEWLRRTRWTLAVLDEAQAIKNAASAQTRAVKQLTSRQRIVLTGTPVENHLGDLWSLFDFCCPGLLGTAAQFKQFVKRLNHRQNAEAYGGLRRLVRPYILRRLKTDPAIAPDLPDKTEMRAECGLTKKQAALYERAVADLSRRLKQSEGIARRGLVLATLMQLKQICNHPAQYLGEPEYSPQDSGKFERLKLLCEPVCERQEKILVFTQFQALTQPLAEYLSGVFGRPGLVLHGGTPVRKRSELVQRFQQDEGPPFFVISLKAGGSGLNLTAASHVVHFDRWWNPAVENQATDRAFRIGQKRNVLVHKFVCRGTVEEHIDAMIQEKQAMADQILSQESETLLTEMSDEELLQVVALDVARATTDE
ncbi:MAG: DEAD/DEAH box helicase [Planctomycetes bacterium]|nr:DEAD/DEAH box helicase [Planctomycetota bacterium]